MLISYGIRFTPLSQPIRIFTQLTNIAHLAFCIKQPVLPSYIFVLSDYYL